MITGLLFCIIAGFGEFFGIQSLIAGEGGIGLIGLLPISVHLLLSLQVVRAYVKKTPHGYIAFGMWGFYTLGAAIGAAVAALTYFFAM